MRRSVMAGLLALAGWAALPGPALAQPLPNGGRSALPPGVGTMTPEQARQRYNSLSPEQKAQVRQAAEQAKAQYGNDPALKAQAKAFLKSWRGQ